MKDDKWDIVKPDVVNHLNELVEYNSSRLLEQLCVQQPDSKTLSLIRCMNEEYSLDLHVKKSCDRLDIAVYDFIGYNAHKILQQFNDEHAAIVDARHVCNAMNSAASDSNFEQFAGMERFADGMSSERLRHYFFHYVLQHGDKVVCEVNSCMNRKLLVDVICLVRPKFGDLSPLLLKNIPVQFDFEPDRSLYQAGDLLQATVMRQFDRNVLGTLKCTTMDMDEFNVDLYTDVLSDRDHGQTFDEFLSKLRLFRNPKGLDLMMRMYGLKQRHHMDSLACSLLDSVRSLTIEPKFKTAREMRLEQNNNMAESLYEKAMTYFKKEDEWNAMRCFNKALEFNCLHVGSLVGRGALNANVSKFNEAICDLTMARTIDHEDAVSKNYLCRVYHAVASTSFDQEHYEKAADYCKKAIDVDSTFPASKDLLHSIDIAISAKKGKVDHTPALPPADTVLRRTVSSAQLVKSRSNNSNNISSNNNSMSETVKCNEQSSASESSLTSSDSSRTFSSSDGDQSDVVKRARTSHQTRALSRRGRVQSRCSIVSACERRREFSEKSPCPVAHSSCEQPLSTYVSSSLRRIQDKKNDRRALDRCRTSDRRALDRCRTSDRRALDRCRTSDRCALDRCRTSDRRALDRCRTLDSLEINHRRDIVRNGSNNRMMHHRNESEESDIEDFFEKLKKRRSLRRKL